MNVIKHLIISFVIIAIIGCKKDLPPYKLFQISQYDLFDVSVYSGDTLVVVGGKKYEVGVLWVKAGRGGQWRLKQTTKAALNTVAFRYGWRGFAAGYKGIILSGYNVWDTIEMLTSPSFSVIYDILDLDTMVYFIGGGEGFLKGTIFRARPGFDWFEELYLPYVLRSICFDGKYLYTGSVGRIYVTTDGRSWDSLFIGKDFYVDKVHIPTKGCYFIGTRGAIVKAYNGKVDLIKKKPVTPLRVIVSAAELQDYLVALTASGTILYFSDNRWKVLTSVPASQCFSIACDNVDKCYVSCEKGNLYQLNFNSLL